MFICTKVLFCVFLNSINVFDFMSECALHLDQKKEKKVVFCQNCMIKKTREKVLLQTYGE